MDRLDNFNYSNRKIIPVVVIVILTIFTIGSHVYLGERPYDYIGVRALLDALYSITLLIMVIIGSFGASWIVLDKIRVLGIEDLEESLISVLIGFGVISCGILFLGLLGYLKPWSLWCWLCIVCCISVLNYRKWARILICVKNNGRALLNLDVIKKTILVIGSGVLILTLIQALTPPWDYDGLLYHLEVPRLFLANEKISPQPEQWLTYFPLMVEMLFTLGLGLGSDVFAKLLHTVFGLLLVLSTFAFGKRYLGTLTAWISVAVLVGIPILSI